MDLISTIKQIYPYFETAEIQLYIDRAKAIMIDHMYPSDYSIDYKTYSVLPRQEMWIVDCVKELIETDGLSSFQSYRENGVSWTRAGTGQISDGLLRRITRIAGTLK